MPLPVSGEILRASVLFPTVLYSTNGKVFLNFLGLTLQCKLNLEIHQWYD